MRRHALVRRGTARPRARPQPASDDDVVRFAIEEGDGGTRVLLDQRTQRTVGTPGDVRGDDQIRQVAQRIVVRQRFGVGHVDRGGDVAAPQTLQHGARGDELRARRVDEHRARSQQIELFASDHAVGRVVQRHMQTDDVAGGEQLVRRRRARGADRRKRLHVRMARPHDDLHAQSARQLRDAAADAPETDQSQRATAQLGDVGCRPPARVGARVECAHMMRQFEHHGDGMFGDRVIAVMDGVAHGDAVPSRRIEIDEAHRPRAAEGDAAHARRDARQQRFGRPESGGHRHRGAVHAPGEHVLVIRPVRVQTDAGQTVEITQPFPEQRRHGGDADGDDDQRQVAAVGVAVDDCGAHGHADSITRARERPCARWRDDAASGAPNRTGDTGDSATARNGGMDAMTPRAMRGIVFQPSPSRLQYCRDMLCHDNPVHGRRSVTEGYIMGLLSALFGGAARRRRHHMGQPVPPPQQPMPPANGVPTRSGVRMGGGPVPGAWNQPGMPPMNAGGRRMGGANPAGFGGGHGGPGGGPGGPHGGPHGGPGGGQRRV